MRIDTPSKITTISIVTKKFSGVNAVSNLSFSVEENIILLTGLLPEKH